MRAWVVLAVVPSILQIVLRPTPAIVFPLLLTAVLVWGVWEGYRIAWIFALIAAALPLVSMLGAGSLFFSLPLAFLVASLVLLIAPSTQEWVNRQEARRGFGPGGGPPRRAA